MQVIDLKINEISVEKISIGQLRLRTIEHKEEWYNDYIDIDFVSNETMKRWMINYVRHELTEYDIKTLQKNILVQNQCPKVKNLLEDKNLAKALCDCADAVIEKVNAEN